MSEDAKPHLSVMLPEVLAALDAKSGDVIIDATFGAGGYTRAILATGAEVIGLDRDPTVRVHADAVKAEFGERFQLIQTPFGDLADAFAQSGKAKLDGAVFDIGVSSMQLDQAERGFSFMRDGPLDMRMADTGETAADIVNTWEHGPLAHIIKLYGEERQAGRVATAILRRRAEQPFSRTLDLAEVIEKALGGRRGAAIHPATRTFQALRIAVNDELGELEGGRLVVVTFHSLEDRIVTNFLQERSGNTPAGSRHAPVAVDPRQPTFALQFKGAQAATAEESAVNPRARSAKLRAAIRTSAPAWTNGGGRK